MRPALREGMVIPLPPSGRVRPRRARRKLREGAVVPAPRRWTEIYPGVWVRAGPRKAILIRVEDC